MAINENNPKATNYTRRAFVVTAAAAAGAAALWKFNHSSLPTVQAGTPPVTIIQFNDAGKATGKITVPRVIKSEADWKKQLNPVSFDVTRHAGTERPYSGATWDLHDKGIFRCICCDLAVFSSDTKFDSGTGWPSFWQPIARENVAELRDTSLGMARTAVSCRLCDAHLGHVFDDGPRPTGQRYCMNSAAMHFVKQA